MKYFTYILLCKDGTFYVGSTNNLEKRLRAHNFLKSGAHYTKMRRPVSLIYFEEFSALGESRRREGALKKLSRAEKQKLVCKKKH